MTAKKTHFENNQLIIIWGAEITGSVWGLTDYGDKLADIYVLLYMWECIFCILFWMEQGASVGILTKV